MWHFSSSLVSYSLIIGLRYSLVGEPNQWKPCHHSSSVAKSCGRAPRLIKSAGFCSERTCLQQALFMWSVTFATRLATKVSHELGGFWRLSKTMIESVNFKFDFTTSINSVNKAAPQSSSLGNEIVFKVATLDLANNRCVWIAPKSFSTRMYVHMLSSKHQRTHESPQYYRAENIPIAITKTSSNNQKPQVVL